MLYAFGAYSSSHASYSLILSVTVLALLIIKSSSKRNAAVVSIIAPGFIQLSAIYGYSSGSPVGEEVETDTISASFTASSIVSTA